MAPIADHELRALLVEDADRGWRAFIDEYTPTLLALIERTGVSRDEAMDIYVRACERLAADDCARLRRHDPGKGPLRSWLAVVVRHVAVDWVRSRAGRRRLFGAVRDLSAFDRRVFELYYWDDRMPTEIAEVVATGEPDVTAVLDALARIDRVLTDRHRAELLSLAARQQHARSLDADQETSMSIPSTSPDPERATSDRQLRRRLDDALRELPSEDAAIVRLKFIQGLSARDVQRALDLPALPESRIAGILARLKALLSGARAAAEEKGLPS